MNLLFSLLSIGFIVSSFFLIISFTPDSTGLPTGIHDAVSTILPYMKTWSIVFNFGQFYAVFLTIISFELLVLTAHIIFLVFRRVFNRV